MLTNVSRFFGKLTDMSEFITFVNNELNARGWTANELGRRAKISSGGISLVLTEQRNPGADFCVKVAHALNVQPEFVLRLAGILPPVSEPVQNESEMLTVYRQLDTDV